MHEFAVPVATGTPVEQAVDADLDAAAAVLHRDAALCARLLDRAATALEGRRIPDRTGRLEQLRGDLAYATGDLLGAGTAYQAARRGWLAAGRMLEVRLAMLGRTRVMAALGEYAEMLPAVLEIQSGIDDLADADERLTTRVHLQAHLQLGEVRAARGDTDGSKRHLDLAEDLAWDLHDLHAVGEICRMRGAVFLVGGLVHRAIDELRRARRAFLDAGSEQAATLTVILVAETLAALGEVAPALALLDRVDRAALDNPWAAAERDVVRAGALLRAGLAQEALDLARVGERTFADLGLMERSARASFVAAAALLRLNRRDEAESELAIAEQLYSGSGARVMRDTTRLFRARVAFAAGDRAAAEQLARQVTENGDRRSPRSLDARSRLLVARASDDDEVAERMLTEAAEIAARLGHVEVRIELRLGRARHLHRTGRTREALDELRRALEVGRTAAGRTPDRAHGTGDFPLLEATDELIGHLVDDGGHAAVREAWQRSRAAKSSALAPLTHRARGWQVAADPEEQAADIDQLLARVQSAPLVPEPEVLLPGVPEGPILDYYVVGDDVLAFVIREGQVHARRLVGAAVESRHLATAWQQECLLSSIVRPAAGDTSSAALDALFATLVAPLGDLLGDLECDPLIVVAHRFLHSVPFDALLDHAAPWRRRLAHQDDEPPLPEPDPVRAVPLTALVLAVPDDEAPLIAAEAAMVAATVPDADVRLGESATRSVLADRSRGMDVVHVAAHGVFRHGNPLFSAIRLGDGWLRAVDLLDGQIRIDGSVVVLSACGSGLAADQTPQPLGLAWSFLHAGAAGVVAALWSVDDEVTLLLMSHFYQRLAAGDHPRTALGAARRAVARVHPHPYFWAPFRYFTPVAGPSERPLV